MSQPQPRSRSSRARRAEEFWNRVTLLIGCGAVVGIVASVIVVLSQQLMKPPLVDEAYMTTTQQNSPAAPVWSGKQDEEPALMDAANREPVPAEEGASNTAAVPAATPVSLSDLPKAVAVEAGIEKIDAKRELISRSVEAFFNATTVDARAAMVRDPARVKPLMMSYYARAPMTPVKWRGLGRVMRVDEPGYRFGYVQALFEDATPANLIVEETGAGDFLIDWECLVRYGEVSWSDFQRMKPADPKLMRVIASKPSGTPTAAALVPAQSEWLELRHPAESGTVLGWFDRSDPKFAALVQQMEQGQWKDVPLTLRLCFPSAPTKLENASVQIAGVEGKGWLILQGDVSL